MTSNKKIKKFYNKKVQNFNSFETGQHIYNSSHKAGVKQILQHSIKPKNVLDGAVGTACFIKRLMTHYPEASYYGADISESMLAISKLDLNHKLNVDFKCSSILNLNDHLPKKSQDLILIHYILSYIENNQLFKKIKPLLKDNGHIQILTTTWENCPKMQNILEKHNFEKFKQETLLPFDISDLKDKLHQTGLEIVDTKKVVSKVKFESLGKLITFGLDGGWFLQSFEKLNPLKILLYKLYCKFFKGRKYFPIEDDFISYAILVKKSNS